VSNRWEIAKRGPDNLGERIDPSSLDSLYEAILGLDRAGILTLPVASLELKGLIEQYAVRGGMASVTIEGSWNLQLVKQYGALSMRWTLMAPLDSNRRFRVLATLGGIILQFSDKSAFVDQFKGEPGLAGQLELDAKGNVLRGGVALGVGGLNRDLITLNYLANDGLPERVVVSRGGIGGRLYDSQVKPAEFAGLTISFSGANYKATDLARVRFPAVCELISSLTENSRIDSPDDFLYVLSAWWEQFGKRQNVDFLPI